VLLGQHRHDGTENLFLHDRRIAWHIDQYRGLNASVVKQLATQGYPRATLNGIVDQRSETLHIALIDDLADVRFCQLIVRVIRAAYIAGDLASRWV
jgi:hypothetical protein